MMREYYADRICFLAALSITENSMEGERDSFQDLSLFQTIFPDVCVTVTASDKTIRMRMHQL